MSCGEPHETDCSEVLSHLYEFLDHEMPDGDCAKFEVHIDECSPCLEKYGLEQAVKKLVKRCCGHDDVPADLRAKVMGRIELIRSGQSVPDMDVVAEARAAEAKAAAERAAAEGKEAREAQNAHEAQEAKGGAEPRLGVQPPGLSAT
ncbi:mycothiol system anti-sigma-R factor [Streptomyces varsoviensis]|uniref:mycothiol system anti-sigma-R factor n=1 Tax=Streptomyces varsoviensis TaxID=67373 RepID=UPI0009961B51|nr:mycothiol system anti-sigma-R factor [Streptomyces varsoviensis]